ncbi:MAG: thiamine pyrophosphate-binding protein [Dehalococcoidia bacterium]|jgi:acetolactate synthase-1/2/3 large subunit|nr:thiamine pyrophosphate-binding protein [Dehalococcoidia bacterium]
MAKVSGSQLVAKSLQANGIDTLFGIAGDHFLHLLDVLVDEPFRMIDTRHEGAASHAADAYARTLRRPGVVLSTTPGHANALAGLVNATHSQAPIINIAGSSDSRNLGRGAMQEFDQVGAAAPITKGAWQIPSAERIPEYINLAVRTAMSGKRGPVHLTIPQDLQEAMVDDDVLDRYRIGEHNVPLTVSGDPGQIAAAIDILKNSEKPMIIAGTGAGATAMPEEFQRLVETMGIPVTTTDSARGLISDDHELSIGFGYLPLNRAVARITEADAVLMLGQQLDFTWGLGGTPPFGEGVKRIMVDASPHHLGTSRSVDVSILGDVGPVITQMADAAGKASWPSFSAWNKSLQDEREKHQAELSELAVEADPAHPMFVSETLQRHITADTPMVFDGGDYAHFFRASVPARKSDRWLYVSSAGMIGINMPYALGLQVALPNHRVVCVTGDGSFGFHGMELDTMVRHNLPVITILGNNSIWGIDWQIQKGLYGRPVWTDLLPTRWDTVAAGLGAYSENVEHASDLDGAMTRAFAQEKPALLNVNIGQVISPVAEEAVSRKLGAHG